MGLAGSTLHNHNDDFQNSYPIIAPYNNSNDNELSNETLCDIISQRPSINIQKASVIRNSINLRRKTLNIINNGNNVYLINFIFDSLYDVEVSIHFCCKEELSEAQGILYNTTKYKTITKTFPKNLNQIYMSDPKEAIDLKNMDINDLKCKPIYESIIPILIVLKAIGAPAFQAQYNFAYIQENDKTIKNNDKDNYKIVMYRQKIQFGNKIFEAQEIFGIEKYSESQKDDAENFLSGRECVICLSEERDTAIFPCRHMCLCNSCANIVRMQNTKCPICRQDVRGLLQISTDNPRVPNN